MKADSSLFTYPHHDCSENQTAHLDEVSQIVLEGQGLLLMLCVYILSEILAREGGRERGKSRETKDGLEKIRITPIASPGMVFFDLFRSYEHLSTFAFEFESV